MQMSKGEVLKFTAQLTHPQTMRNWRKDFHRLFRNAPALFRTQVLQRPHVVQTISQLNQYDSHVVDHGQQHLTDVFCLLVFAGDVADLRDLGQAVNQVGDLFAKVVTDSVEINECIFNHIVQ
jgi:hypothetical protein